MVNMMTEPDQDRQSKHAKLILTMLEDAASRGEWVFTNDLIKVSQSHTRRICDLRQAGHSIVCARVPADNPRYAPGATWYKHLGFNPENKHKDRLRHVLRMIGKLNHEQLVVVAEEVNRLDPTILNLQWFNC